MRISQTPPVKRVIATTVLRKFNRQWRILIHHAIKFKSSAYTGDQMLTTLNNHVTNKRLRGLKKSAVTNDEGSSASLENTSAFVSHACVS